MNLHPFCILFTGLMVILWIYTALSKIFNFNQFKHAMLTQVFPNWMGLILMYTLPFLELGVAIALIIPKTRLLGMYSSLFLMIMFTLYVGGAVLHIYERQPCACGGLFARLGWYKHFKVNIILTLVAFVGVLLLES